MFELFSLGEMQIFAEMWCHRNQNSDRTRFHKETLAKRPNMGGGSQKSIYLKIFVHNTPFFFNQIICLGLVYYGFAYYLHPITA